MSWAGARLKFLLITLGAFVAAVVAVFAIDELMKSLTGEYKLLKQYQRNRLLVFLDPSADTSGAGYNLNQAMIAIGSGGLFGKGLLNASQSSLGFVPEAPTDFIFCVLAEQFGFAGRAFAPGPVYRTDSFVHQNRQKRRRSFREP